jgi:hypothetical protein
MMKYIHTHTYTHTYHIIVVIGYELIRVLADFDQILEFWRVVVLEGEDSHTPAKRIRVVLVLRTQVIHLVVPIVVGGEEVLDVFHVVAVQPTDAPVSVGVSVCVCLCECKCECVSNTKSTRFYMNNQHTYTHTHLLGAPIAITLGSM